MERIQDPEYREAFLEDGVHTGIAWQIRCNREQRGMTQDELAQSIDSKQSAVSRMEDPDYASYRVDTLVKVAKAFNCALIVRFASYDEFLALSADSTPERLYAPEFVGAQLSIEAGVCDVN